MDDRETPPDVTADRLRTAGQRRVNIIWEITQSLIAVMVTVTTLYAAATGLPGTDQGLLGSAFFLVVGFYFGRTNHSRQGGIGHR